MNKYLSIGLMSLNVLCLEAGKRPSPINYDGQNEMHSSSKTRINETPVLHKSALKPFQDIEEMLKAGQTVTSDEMGPTNPTTARWFLNALSYHRSVNDHLIQPLVKACTPESLHDLVVEASINSNPEILRAIWTHTDTSWSEEQKDTINLFDSFARAYHTTLVLENREFKSEKNSATMSLLKEIKATSISFQEAFKEFEKKEPYISL